MSIASMTQRFLAQPPRNVGGGDMLTRMLAIIALLLLAAMISPQAKVHFPLLKIALLVTAELGLVSLMLGLFLRSKTYFTGLQLFSGSLLMLWLVNKNLPYLAIGVGLAFVVLGAISVVTRRSRLNNLLELSSMRVPLQEVEAAAAHAANPTHLPIKPLTEGGAR
jgi:hypothetical protein